MQSNESGDLARQALELSAENARLHALVDSLERSQRLLRVCRVEILPRVLGQVHHERDRSQRYNSFFALLSIECARRDAADKVLGRVQRSLRSSDVVSIVDKDPIGRDLRCEDKGLNIGVLMPHTNGKGAKVAMERAKAAVGDDLRRSVLAVYPDDSTDWAKLVRMVTE